jgi:hypothetical protein
MYAILAGLGLILPYFFFLRYLFTSGPERPPLIDSLFANDIATFFVADLVIATIVFWVFMAADSAAAPVPYRWVCFLGSLLVGLSFALPLYLYLRAGAQGNGPVADSQIGAQNTR